MTFVRVNFFAEGADGSMVDTEEHYYGFQGDVTDETIANNWAVLKDFHSFEGMFDPEDVDCYFEFEYLDTDAFINGQVVPKNTVTEIVNDLTLETSSNS